MPRDVTRISIIIPVFNERESLPILKRELEDVMQGLLPLQMEVIFVDDGSTDGSTDVLRAFAAEGPHLKVILCPWNEGQTAAMRRGIAAATGDVIIPMDADLQNDPADIPRLLQKIQEGHTCVSGWRKDRKDAMWSRTIPSIVANRLISWMTGVSLHDFGCSLKAYRSDIIKNVSLYGEMHRFIPAYAAWRGARVTEITVNHRARQFGASKYGLMRVIKVSLDLIVVKFLVRYFDRPMHFFGGVGFYSLGTGVVALVAAIVLKFFAGRPFVETPLPIIGALFVILGVQFILTGLLAEVLMRTYHAARKEPDDVERLNS